MLPVLQLPRTHYKGVVYCDVIDSTPACVVNKGICGGRMSRWVTWLQDAPIRKVIRNRVSTSEDPQAKKRVGIANTEDNCRDVCVVRATTAEYNACY